MTVSVFNLSKEHTNNTNMFKMKTNHIEIVDLENVIGQNENNIFFIESNSKLQKFHPRHGPLELRTELFWQKFLNLKP